MDHTTIRAAADLIPTYNPDRIRAILGDIQTADNADQAADIALQHAKATTPATRLMVLAGWSVYQAWPATNRAHARRDLNVHRQNSPLGDRYRFPNGATALVINPPREPHRLEVRSSSLDGDGIARNLTPADVDRLLHHIAAL